MGLAVVLCFELLGVPVEAATRPISHVRQQDGFSEGAAVIEIAGRRLAPLAGVDPLAAEIALASNGYKTECLAGGDLDQLFLARAPHCQRQAKLR